MPPLWRARKRSAMRAALLWSSWALASDAAVVNRPSALLRSGRDGAASRATGPVFDPLSLLAWGDKVAETSQLVATPANSSLRCGESIPIHSASDKWEKCPSECPLIAEHQGNGVHCDFRCVEATADACRTMQPAEVIPDTKLGICRACIVSGCAKCATDGTDTCGECSNGYDLIDGECHSQFFYAWVAAGLGAAVVAGVVLAWFIDLARRPIVNPAALSHALRNRSRGKPRMPKQGDQSRQLWPLTTNLCREEDVCGPGLTLEFNFQVAIIVWALVLGLSWMILANNYDRELLTLGLRKAENARQNCIIVSFGYETQRRLMFAKTCYLVGAYLFSFFYFVTLSIRHRRLFQIMDEDNLTHKDFCARCFGLPEMKGCDRVEEELKAAIAEATGKDVVGVSIAWLFNEIEDEVMDQLASDLAERRTDLNDPEEKETGEAEPEEAAKDREQCWAFQQVENKVFGSDTQDIISGAADDGPKTPIKESLEGLVSTAQAFVIFRTEQARNEAVRAIEEKGGMSFRGETVMMENADHEPASMQWKNVIERSTCWVIKRVIGGFGTIFLSLATWVLAFYAPYAYFLMSFNYAYGQEPGIASNLAFTVIVVIGNAMMYFVCGEVADRIGFQYLDDREVCYMLLYSFACICNVVLDMVVTFYMAYWMMVGVGMATYHGVPLGEVTSFQGRFEAYAMQRSLGQNLWAYSFPSTFLVPFIIEPIATIYLPYKLMSFVVRSNKNISKHDAEGLMMPAMMDLSRYADILLNVMLAALVFFFPGGFTHRMFLALAMSHVVIYLVDHYKVLRCIPSCYFSSDCVDWWAIWMLSIPTAFIAGAIVFKANCQEGDKIGFCIRGLPLLACVIGAFVLSIVVHTLVLVHVVPIFAKKQTPESTTPYDKIAAEFPCSWFASNPVHCLRSKHIYNHDPPCDFYIAGKEHTMRRNPDIGCYFEDTVAEGEDYTSSPVQHLKSFGDTLRKSFTKGGGDELETPSPKGKGDEVEKPSEQP